MLENTGINNRELSVSWKYGLLFFMNIKHFCLYVYVVLSCLILLKSLLCMHETHLQYGMTVFVLKPVISLVMTCYIGTGDV